MQHDLSVINSLITTTIDSADGFEKSAEIVKWPELQMMFNDYARQRREIVSTLQDFVLSKGGTPNDDGSLLAEVHRRWEELKAALSREDEKAVIDEVERGEDFIKNKYESAMSDSRLSPETRALLAQAIDSVRRGHDRASRLKHGIEIMK